LLAASVTREATSGGSNATPTLRAGHQRTDAGVLERTIVEVGSQGDDDLDGTVVVDHLGQRIEERTAALGVGDGEQLLERTGTRDHRGHEGTTVSLSGHHTRSHQRGLARARGSDDGDEPRVFQACLELGHQLSRPKKSLLSPSTKARRPL
jgi:hypothetical protein